jgi:hypothetical protein
MLRLTQDTSQLFSMSAFSTLRVGKAQPPPRLVGQSAAAQLSYSRSFTCYGFQISSSRLENAVQNCLVGRNLETGWRLSTRGFHSLLHCRPPNITSPLYLLLPSLKGVKILIRLHGQYGVSSVLASRPEYKALLIFLVGW